MNKSSSIVANKLKNKKPLVFLLKYSVSLHQFTYRRFHCCDKLSLLHDSVARRTAFISNNLK